MSKKIKLRIMRLPHAADLPLPAYQSAGAAGLDLMAAVPEDAPIALAPGQRANVPTGLSIALPRGSEGQVRPRSGLAARNGITVLNAPGTVDSDYRGEVLACIAAQQIGGAARPERHDDGDRPRWEIALRQRRTAGERKQRGAKRSVDERTVHHGRSP